MTRRALLVVDVQNDFCAGGSLAVDGGHAVARAITDFVRAHAGDYAVVAASRDWHRASGDNGGHFAITPRQPDYAATWPAHCVAGTPGADYAPGWDATLASMHVVKGMGVAAYSMFDGVVADREGTPAEPATRLADALATAGIDSVDVVGIATDYCVRQTAADAARLGLRTRVLVDLTAAVAPATRADALAALAAHGVEIAGG